MAKERLMIFGTLKEHKGDLVIDIGGWMPVNESQMRQIAGLRKEQIFEAQKLWETIDEWGDLE
jgi:hypothetical protein